MRKMKTGLAIAAILTGLAGTAHASDSGTYLAIQGGVVVYPSNVLDSYYTALGGSTFTNATGSGDFFGAGSGRVLRGVFGYQVNSSFAIEASGLNFGKITYSGNSASGSLTAVSKANGASLTLVSVTSGGQPGDYLHLLIKLGVATIRSSSTITTSIPGADKSPLGGGKTTDFTYGFAVKTDLTDSLSFRVDWDSYHPPANSAGRLNTWLFGLSYMF